MRLSSQHEAGGRTARSISIVLCLFLYLCGLTSVTATQTGTAPASLDPACIRFNDPNAVTNGGIPYADFSAFVLGVDHAVDAWSLDRGFAIELREIVPTTDEVPEEVNLIYRDVSVPGSGFKGVTVTWAHAPATITLNRANLPSPDTTDVLEQELIRAVVTHETGHALGLGDVPAPGVNIRECGNMLMKRSVDKGGGHITAPQPGDIVLYCMRWGGDVCGDEPLPVFTPGSAQVMALEPHTIASPPAASAASASELTATYRYLVVKCEQLPEENLTADQVESDDLPVDPQRECLRVPAGVLFHVHRDDGDGAVVLTNRRGEFTFQKPEGIGVEVDMPAGGNGRFPSLIGYQPLETFDHIPASDPDCESGTLEVCKRVYVLVP